MISLPSKQPRIVIVDYNGGNTYSVLNALRKLKYNKILISANAKEIELADALILPGVGAFGQCVSNLRERHLDSILDEAVNGKGKPILGICVGMQLMATESEENGIHSGLNWIPGKVIRLAPSEVTAVPHVGWNDVTSKVSSSLLARTQKGSNFYFDHSYEYICNVQNDAIAYCDYGKPVVAAISRGKIFGVQFHPEKSQEAGLKIFRSFFDMVATC